MEYNEALEYVRQAAHEHSGVDLSQIKPETRYRLDLAFDSLDGSELELLVSEKMGTDIDFSEIIPVGEAYPGESEITKDVTIEELARVVLEQYNEQSSRVKLSQPSV